MRTQARGSFSGSSSLAEALAEVFLQPSESRSDAYGHERVRNFRRNSALMFGRITPKTRNPVTEAPRRKACQQSSRLAECSQKLEGGGIPFFFAAHADQVVTALVGVEIMLAMAAMATDGILLALAGPAETRRQCKDFMYLAAVIVVARCCHI